VDADRSLGLGFAVETVEVLNSCSCEVRARCERLRYEIQGTSYIYDHEIPRDIAMGTHLYMTRYCKVNRSESTTRVITCKAVVCSNQSTSFLCYC